MKERKLLGIISILIGFVFILNSFSGITGFVVAESIGKGISGILGLVFIIGGILVFTSGRNQANNLEIKVYDSFNGKEGYGKEGYSMTDPELYFSKIGLVTLGEFKRGLNEIEKDPELYSMVKEEYGPPLLDIENSEGVESKIAEEFLSILYKRKISSNEEIIELISKKEINKIRTAFDSGWTGTPNNNQNKVLKDFDLVYDPSSKHPKIYSKKNPKISESVSNTPSDINAGKNVARDIIGLVKECRDVKS